MKIFSAHWVTLVNPSYELWELAARFELEPLEKYCRLAARGRADAILSKGEGVKYDRQDYSSVVRGEGVGDSNGLQGESSRIFLVFLRQEVYCLESMYINLIPK
jgi:hypothetical protein